MGVKARWVSILASSAPYLATFRYTFNKVSYSRIRSQVIEWRIGYLSDPGVPFLNSFREPLQCQFAVTKSNMDDADVVRGNVSNL